MMLRRQSIAFNAFIRKEESSQVNDLNFHLKKLENEQEIKPKTDRRKDIIKVREKNQSNQSRKTIETTNEIIFKKY